MKSYSNKAQLYNLLLAITSAFCIWLSNGFITFIAFNESVAGVKFEDLLLIFSNIDIFQVLTFPEFWEANANHSFIEAPGLWFEPVTILSSISSLLLIILFSMYVIKLKSETISLSLLLIGFLYLLVSWGVLLDVSDAKMIGPYLSIGIQGLLLHSFISCLICVFTLSKNVYFKFSTI
ncbi:hypothetical protein [Pseudoalteromonas sp. S3178]|uniref:hypothetical protein n=1 Tax=Pseudoalteromonas sp. S3178 TaxID=579532 RepID=UPI00110AFCA4|nr:hypothetical protein [Pseudoalteromonas sp. S3178]